VEPSALRELNDKYDVTGKLEDLAWNTASSLDTPP